MRPRLVLVPGYRVPMEHLPRGLLGRQEFEANRGRGLLWWRRLDAALGHLDLDLFVYNWPNRGDAEREELETAERVQAFPPWPPETLRAKVRWARIARDRWRRARAQADRAGLRLRELLDEPERTLLVGHSLGGKVALRAAEAAGKEGARAAFACVAFGPAVLERNLDWEAARRGTLHGVEVFHGRRDRTLGLLYRLGNLHLRRPVGLVGLSLRHAHHARVVDITPFQSADHRNVHTWRANHNWYRDHVARALGMSQLWERFAAAHALAAPLPRTR